MNRKWQKSGGKFQLKRVFRTYFQTTVTPLLFDYAGKFMKIIRFKWGKITLTQWKKFGSRRYYTNKRGIRLSVTQLSGADCTLIAGVTSRIWNVSLQMGMHSVIDVPNVTLWYGVPCLLYLYCQYWNWLWIILELSSNDTPYLFNWIQIWWSRRPR